jgi:endoglucanase
MKRQSTMKLLILLLILAMCTSVIGCEDNNVKTEDEANTPVTSNEEVKAEEQTAAIILPGQHIMVNQVGYLSMASKVAVITGEVTENSFDLINLNTGKIAMTGKLSEVMEDKDSGDTVRHADFSKQMQSGRYVLSVPGAGQSFPFEIHDFVYRKAFVDSVRIFTMQRSSTVIHDPMTGYSFSAGHLQDEKAQLFFSDDVSKEGEVVDVSGGWYDAGDFGKYVPPGAASAAFLLLAYDLTPERFTTGQLMFPKGVSEEEQAADLPDLLAEVKFQLDWIMKMQRSDGVFYHKVAGIGWPGMDVLPSSDLMDRFIFGKSTYGTAISAGALAMASRIFEAHDPAYAAKLLTSAEKGFAYLEKHPEFEYHFSDNQDNGSGPYKKDTDQEDRFWAAAELLRTTGDKKYNSYLQDQFAPLFEQNSEKIGFDHPLLFGQWAYYHSEAGDTAWKEKIKQVITTQADGMVAHVQGNGYRSALQSEEYVWGSNRLLLSKGVSMLLANELAPKQEYEEAALDQLHYVFGRNALSQSYVVGEGTKYPRYPHHRTINTTGVLIPGLMVGGPNKFGGDASVDQIKDALPPAKVYVDDGASFSSNEFALDYNAPLSFVLAYFGSE